MVLLSVPMVQPSYIPDINSIILGVGYIYKIVKVLESANKYIKAANKIDGRAKDKEAEAKQKEEEQQRKEDAMPPDTYDPGLNL